jgi:single-stranded-DNA-specific exonuclease
MQLPMSPDLSVSESLNLYTSKSLMGKVWHLPTLDEATIRTYKTARGLSDRLATLLVTRQIPLDDVEHFLNPRLKHSLPDPFSFADMEKAVALTLETIRSQRKIMILGDYDVDGATSTALLYRFFKGMDVDVGFHIPHRFEEGYGPSIPIFERFINEGAGLAITVDCGTTADEPLAYAQEKGLPVIVLDHHKSNGEALPPAAALINPHRHDAPHDEKHVAAVGITFLFLVALQKHLRAQGWYEEKGRDPIDLLGELDLVALGTVCDVMPP